MKTLVVLLAVQSGFLFTIFCVVSATKTIHVCENEEKIISCDIGIEVFSAQYGRFDRVTCLHKAMSEVDCFDDVLPNILSKCEGKTTCKLSPSNTKYGDPCPGTFKYLKVQFNCLPSETTTQSPTTTTPSMTTIITTTEQSTSEEATTVSILSTTETTRSSTLPEVTTKTTTTPSTTTITTTTAEQYTSQKTTTVPTPFTTHIAITNRNGTTTSSLLPTSTSCFCNCQYTNDTDCKNGDLVCLLAKLRQQLTINKTTLSSFKRTKISVYDGRTSARVIGFLGVAVIVTVLTIIVMPDFFRLIKYVFYKANITEP